MYVSLCKKILAVALLGFSNLYVMAQLPLYRTSGFSIFSNRIVQGKYMATAESEKKITSNYKSPENLFQSATITFKFAINGRDNEMVPGMDHRFTVNAVNGSAQTPVIIFGKQLSSATAKTVYLQPNTKLKVRLNFKDVLKQFKDKGYYTTYDGTKIYQQDFKGVYIAGGTLPMIWDFDNLYHHDNLQLKDPDGDGIYETDLVLNVKQDQKRTDTEWNLSKDISHLPTYVSPHPLPTAIYNMSLEEMLRAVEPDSTFRTGKEWAGVWTRDISYSIILSMSYMQPKVAMYSLLRKVNKKKRIIQDTGTGGAYPASTDRIVWAVAAWEVYKATGDPEWLRLIYEIVKNSIEDDLQNVYDPATGLVKGESSFLDWRDQTYPKWMQPADIFESECLGTNAVHYQANIVLAEMAKILNQPAVTEKHLAIAARIKTGINTFLWMPEKGYYAQYLYGNNFKMVSPRSEALGEALCILFGIADQQRAEQVIASVPTTQFGVTCIYPQIPGIPPYHNNAVWPFVQSYWALAAAKVKNARSLLESVACIYRPAALFLTNKENFVADNGDFAGTQINSSNMLWSLSGNIGLVHRIFFGIEYTATGLSFHPMIPMEFNGIHRLLNFTYRNAQLDIEVQGYGSAISAFMVDGELLSNHTIASTLTGKHAIRIVLSPASNGKNQINKVANIISPATPVVKLVDKNLSWSKVEGATTYRIISNGKDLQQTTTTNFPVTNDTYSEYQVIAQDKNGVPSFASEPVILPGNNAFQLYEVEKSAPQSTLAYKGFSGTGFVETNTTVNTIIRIPVEVTESGDYMVDFKYANGNGPTNTENKCAIRTFSLDGKKAGTIIFPQRGTNEWNNWGFTNTILVTLEKGKHELLLSYETWNENMNGETNQALIDQARLRNVKF